MVGLVLNDGNIFDGVITGKFVLTSSPIFVGLKYGGGLLACVG
jgi:hypothetical protein